MMSSNTKFHKQPVCQACTDDTCYRTGTQMARQAVLIDICFYFSIWIILLGYPIFSCFTTDASSSFIYSTIPTTFVRWRKWTALLVSQTPAPSSSQIPHTVHIHLVWRHLQQWLYLHITITYNVCQNSLHTQVLRYKQFLHGKLLIAKSSLTMTPLENVTNLRLLTAGISLQCFLTSKC